ncbi:MAG: hypothetical protein CM15mP46_1890 [Alphaproteobacteria bacterium]|nr:MAG: hypothetical protein CM15mP46_1890 [Alphaproteobacteria bacterium]
MRPGIGKSIDHFADKFPPVFSQTAERPAAGLPTNPGLFSQKDLPPKAV